MFSLNSAQRYRLYTQPTDMRKGFDGLCGIINRDLAGRPKSGEVFVFVNRRRDKMKLLHWEPGGLVLYYKRLEKGTFTLPKNKNKTHTITWTELMLIVEGIKHENTKKKARYFPTNSGV